MNEFDGYDCGYGSGSGWGNGCGDCGGGGYGDDRGNGNGWGSGSGSVNCTGEGCRCTGSTPFKTICPLKPSLGNFLIYAFCIIALLLGLWMI